MTAPYQPFSFMQHPQGMLQGQTPGQQRPGAPGTPGQPGQVPGQPQSFWQALNALPGMKDLFSQLLGQMKGGKNFLAPVKPTGPMSTPASRRLLQRPGAKPPPMTNG